MVDTSTTSALAVALERRARGHRVVAFLTLFSSAVILLIVALSLFGFDLGWLTPESGSKLSSESETKDWQVYAAALVANSTARIVALAAVSYLAHLMATVYQYNIRMSGHYWSRAQSMRACNGDLNDAEAMARILNPNRIEFGKHPLIGETGLLAPDSKGAKPGETK